MVRTFNGTYLWVMQTINLGRQLDGLPWAVGLLFAGLFGTLHHLLWLPACWLAGAMVSMAQTQVEVGPEMLAIRRTLAGQTFWRTSWPLSDIEGAVLLEHRDATTYTSHSQRNTIRAHSFALVLRLKGRAGHETSDVEAYEFTEKSLAERVMLALKQHRVHVA